MVAKDNAKDVSEVTAEDVQTYIAKGLRPVEEGGDLHFQNMHLFMEMLCAVELLHEGYRADPNGDMDSYDTGRLFLLPLLFALNRSQYAPAIVNELAMLYHCMPTALRKMRRSWFSPGKWGWDLRNEYFNKAQKNLMSNTNAPTSNMIIRSALLVGHSVELDAALRRNLSMETDKQRHDHSYGDMNASVAMMFQHFVKMETLLIVEGRKHCLDISMKGEVQPKRTPVELLKYGKDKMDEFLPVFLTTGSAKFPVPIVMSDARQQEIDEKPAKRAEAADRKKKKQEEQQQQQQQEEEEEEEEQEEPRK
jgi:hypothetical protein